MCSLLERLLRDAGYTQVSRDHGPAEVCALHRKNDYDLILLDLQMPGDGRLPGDGGAARPTCDDDYLPVIVLTAQPGHKLRALQAGAKDFISKPFDLVEVKTRIHNMLEVRLLYRRLEDAQRAAGADGAGAHRRAARERGPLPQPDRTGVGLVLGAGRERPVHQGLGPGAGDAGHPGRAPGGRRRAERGRRRAGTRPSAPCCAPPSPPASPSWTFSSAASTPTARAGSSASAASRCSTQACRFIGYRGIGVEIMRDQLMHAMPTSDRWPRRTARSRTICWPRCRPRSSSAWRRIWNACRCRWARCSTSRAASCATPTFPPPRSCRCTT